MVFFAGANLFSRASVSFNSRAPETVIPEQPRDLQSTIAKREDAGAPVVQEAPHSNVAPSVWVASCNKSRACLPQDDERFFGELASCENYDSVVSVKDGRGEHLKPPIVVCRAQTDAVPEVPKLSKNAHPGNLEDLGSISKNATMEYNAILARVLAGRPPLAPLPRFSYSPFESPAVDISDPFVAQGFAFLRDNVLSAPLRLGDVLPSPYPDGPIGASTGEVASFLPDLLM